MEATVEFAESPLVGFEQFPRVADVEPPVEFDTAEAVLGDEAVDDSGEFELPAVGFGHVQQVTGPLGEGVRTCVRERRRRTGRLLDDARYNPSVERTP